MAIRVLRGCLLLCGVALFVGVAASVDLREVFGMIGRMSWGLAAVLAVYVLTLTLDTWGWRFAFARRLPRTCRWLDLFAVRLVGEAVNYVTPMAALGGEPVKADLLKRGWRFALADGVASVVLAKTSITISLVLFVISGLCIASASGVLPDALNRLAVITLALLAFALAAFVATQQVGMFRWISGWLRWVPGLRGAIDRRGHRILHLDTTLAEFYRRSDFRMIWSVLFHGLGWLVGVVEIYLVLRFLGLEISLLDAWVLESIWQLIRAASFFVPAAIGTQEGGIVWIGAGFGIASSFALAVALVRRIRELVWAGVGLGLWWWFERRFAVATQQA